MIFQLPRSLRFWTQGLRLRLQTPLSILELSGEDVEVVKKLLAFLCVPRTKEDALAHDENFEAAWNFLEEAHALEEGKAPSEFAARYQVESLSNEKGAVGIAAGFEDIDLMQKNASAVHGKGSFLPVVFEGNRFFIGPWVKPGTACCECLKLRLKAKQTREVFEGTLALESWAEHVHAAVLSRSEEMAWVSKHVQHYVEAMKSQPFSEHSWVMQVSLGSQEVSWHPLFPHSHCFCQQGKTPTLRSLETEWAHENTPPSAKGLQHYRDAQLGIFNYLEADTKGKDYFSSWPMCIGGFNLVRGKDYVSTGLHGHMGVGPSLEEVRLVAASEGFERYALANRPPDLVEKSYLEVASKAVHPLHFALYEEEQYARPNFSRRKFTPETPLWWNWALGLVSRESRLVPHEWVTTSLSETRYPQRTGDQYFSTGGASHLSYERAVLNGLREIIERDAYMICWYKQIQLAEVVLPADLNDTYANSLRTFLKDRQIEFTVLDLRLDLPFPTFLTLAQSTKEYAHWPAGGVVLSATCDVSPLRALTRGLREIVLHYETLVQNPGADNDYRRFSYKESDAQSGYREWIPNYLHYLKPEHARKTEFLKAAQQRISLADIQSFSTGKPSEDLRRVVGHLQAIALEPWVVNLTTEDIRPSGFKVVRVLVPGMTDLTPARQSRRLAFDRLEKVSAMTGRSLLPHGQVNEFSHPNA